MCHVLIIEDEIVVALDLQGILAAHGASTFAFATSENEAIDQARRARPDFISSDVNLSEGTGPRAVATIHQEHGPIPVVYVTATPEDCESCPPDRILGKPIIEAQVLRAFLRLAPICWRDPDISTHR